jgi:hypothetical protein
MSICLQNAMMTAQFGSDGIHVPQLFIVNEAEAAAMHALGSDNSFLNVSSLDGPYFLAANNVVLARRVFHFARLWWWHDGRWNLQNCA